MNSLRNKALLGSLCAAAGGICWGFSGTCGQYLMQVRSTSETWMVTVRMLVSGLLILALCFAARGRRTFTIIRNDLGGVVLFAVFGLALCQYSYFAAIHASNAGTATALQYTGPAMILVYTSLREKRLPTRVEVAAIVLSLLGILLLATHGQPGTLVLSPQALAWGLISAVTLAIYTLLPVKLIRQYGTLPVTGWGMFIGGLMLWALFRPGLFSVKMDAMMLGGLSGVILVGTLLAYNIYLKGVELAGPKKASLIATIEPVSAAVFAAALMHSVYTPVDLVGFGVIIAAVVLISVKKE